MVSVNIDAGTIEVNHLLLGLTDVLGPSEVDRLKPSGLTNERLGELRSRMDSLYGKTGASGLAICSGRAAFKYLLKKQGKELGFEDAAYRFLPTRLKIRKGLEILAQWMEKIYALPVNVINDERDFHFRLGDPEHDHDLALCDFTAGLLQGFLAWTSGGKYYLVREIECRAVGASGCDFQVGKIPLE
jgi:hypothetical protein